ncbi:CheR family methyltransferase [Aurantiacibacter rhizosphaerae]|uniref:histidine kinase n=1 Tax=Aurantiacibacter rhizosphaerae TaxID=2691582 RepID=A0A844XHE2_9SPHN|nr:CheR family methyltransferase [Aurantiacibacter rhizosphaerae]MWV28955.1 PAS domain-containing protein [Aurantiacibacter rhizosphaerae]
MSESDEDANLGLPIVGIGASAGGLEALNELVGAIPSNSGIAYVIVQHLSPDHVSMMDQLLANHTQLPIKKIEDGMRAQADTIYVLPSGPWVTTQHDILYLHDRDPSQALRTPIDKFLESLAEDKGAQAFAVILSGTGTDGTLGVRAVKAAGGFAIVQKSDSAQFPGMPDSAAATGLVDFTLPPRRIPERLIDIVRHRDQVLTVDGTAKLREDIADSLPEILEAMDDEDGLDFSEYKPGTLIRRIERRMMVTRDVSVSDFKKRLRDDPQERGLLLQDFLIGVTRFFRDEEAFAKLNQEAILPLLDGDQDAFRIWVPGCSTGEEAYTIAMLLSEAMEATGDNRQWQIFGTDIDASALRHAREGIYPASQVAEISPERRDRFFTGEDGAFQVKPLLRERCIFAPHNLLQDPPFSRLDLISCRNLLIYLNADVQQTIFPRFHYALKQGGFLFIGPSESLGKQERFFHTIDREARLFKRNDAEPAAFSSLPMSAMGGTRRERRLGRAATPSPTQPVTLDHSFENQVLTFFARQSAAPFAVINSSDEISYLSEPMSRYISPNQGQPSSAIEQFLMRDLRLPVRNTITEARQLGRVCCTPNVVLSADGDPEVVDVEARPLPFAEGSLLVTLQPVRMQDASKLTGSSADRSDEERDWIERELTTVRQQLSSTMASYETTEQELKSSNEELLSMNEELQSSNEELETSREELQSINEELETVNAELSENNRQLLAVNSDLKNLFDSTDIATVFLDQHLKLRRYTPASRRLFGVRERDIGRNINELKWQVSYDDLEADAARVTETLQPLEREVRIEATEETFLMRIRPYRRTDDRIDGCVLTFFDITERKRFERQIAENAEMLAKQYAELETLYRTTPVGLCLVDRDLRWLRINDRLAQINGFPVADHIGKKQGELLPEIDEDIRDIQKQVLATGKPALGIQLHGTTPAQPDIERDWVVDYFPVLSAEGEVFAVGCCVTEVTEQKTLQRDLEESEARLNFALETSELGAWELCLDDKNAETSLLHDRIFGYDKKIEEWNLHIFLDHVLDDDRALVRDAFDKAASAREDWEFECRVCRADGEMRWIAAHGRPRMDDVGKVISFLGTVQDITTRKEAQEQQYLLLHELQHRVKNSMATTLAIVQFSSRRATDLEGFIATLRDRLQAISRTHDLLTAEDWKGARVSQMLKSEIEPYIEDESSRIRLEGDDPLLTSKQMLSLTLAFHELATNAAKHGALTNEKGTVTLTTQVEDGSTVVMTWKEHGGPPVSEPERNQTGFGSLLLEKIIGPDLQGGANLAFNEDGIEWTVSFPLQSRSDAGPSA